MTEPEIPLKVHLVESSVKLYPTARDRTASFQTVTLDDTSLPVAILGHAPKRRAATIIVQGATTDSVVISGDRSDAQNGQGAKVMAGTPPLFFTGTGDVWAGSATGAITVAVISEYEAS